MLKNNQYNIYQISDKFADLTEEQINDDTYNFFLKYLANNKKELNKDSISDIFLLYMCQYLVTKDKLFDEKLN